MIWTYQLGVRILLVRIITFSNNIDTVIIIPGLYPVNVEISSSSSTGFVPRAWTVVTGKETNNVPTF